MAFKPEDLPNSGDGNASYPQGFFLDEQTPGLRDGSPLRADWVNDICGFLQRMISEAGITPSGDPDTVLASDYYDSLIEVIETSGASFPVGTVMLFGQASAPTGWTKSTTFSADNSMLTINAQADGTALASGGSANPQDSHDHTMNAHTHDAPAHTHGAGTLRFKILEADQVNHVVRGELLGGTEYAFLRRLSTGGTGTTPRLTIDEVDDYYTYSDSGSGSTASDGGTATGTPSAANTSTLSAPMYQEIIACTKD